MRTVEEVAASLDLNLVTLCSELIRWSETGVLEDGQIRKLERSLVDEGHPRLRALSLAENYVKFRAVRVISEK